MVNKHLPMTRGASLDTPAGSDGPSSAVSERPESTNSPEGSGVVIRKGQIDGECASYSAILTG